jgi:hypothetical protein
MVFWRVHYFLHACPLKTSVEEIRYFCRKVTGTVIFFISTIFYFIRYFHVESEFWPNIRNPASPDNPVCGFPAFGISSEYLYQFLDDDLEETSTDEFNKISESIKQMLPPAVAFVRCGMHNLQGSLQLL